jgi:hypothetical protein
MAAEVKELPDDKATSKYSPVDEKVGAPTGSDPYWATVRAPTPVALAVQLSLVQVAVPDEPDEERFASWLNQQVVLAGSVVAAVRKSRRSANRRGLRLPVESRKSSPRRP